ncbi:hypothetical protein GQ55_1G058200 [Panicum hallii var. hallii]|uniref:Uncharacterized protein n=1 Tax=Panicum hallii var. hallii TaxID=1504633 RepID=A0A2T7F2P4_9POAL|nr:hypothetical protein GQ55_1G058200 [Panicum hallii var. hallii]
MPMLPETTEDPERGVLTTYTMFECLSLLSAMAEDPYIGEVMCWLSEDRLLCSQKQFLFSRHFAVRLTEQPASFLGVWSFFLGF